MRDEGNWMMQWRQWAELCEQYARSRLLASQLFRVRALRDACARRAAGVRSVPSFVGTTIVRTRAKLDCTSGNPISFL